MATSDRIRKGNDLMVYVGGNGTAESTYKSVAFATNHTLTVTMETEDIQSKDHGYNGAVLPKRITWEVQSENLYIDGEYETLFGYMTDKKPVWLKWGNVADATSGNETIAEKGIATDDTYDSSKNYAATSAKFSGKAYITSLVANAQAGENATYSVTFTGTGDFTKS